MERLICIVIGYIFGLIQSGYLYGKANHMDIRQYGSGNAGSTNVLRVMGKKAGAIVFLGDFFKAVFAMAVCRLLFKKCGRGSSCIVCGSGSHTRSQFPVLPEIQGRQGNCLHGGHHDSDGSADYADLFRDFLRDGVPDPLCIAWFDSCVDHLFCRACDL